MSGAHILTPQEGAAWRYQLDCMLAVLNATPGAPEDPATARLIGSLAKAREAAVEIETRIPPEPPAVMALADKPDGPKPTGERKGVSLARR